MADFDLTTLAAVKEEMETSVATADAVISTMISEASRAIMRYVDRRIAPLDTSDSDREFESPGHGRIIRIDDLSITPTAVVVLAEDGTAQTVLTVATDLVLLPRNRESWQPIDRLQLRKSAAELIPGEVIRVTGKWGWPSIPEDISRACIITVRAWLRKDSSGFAEVADFGRQVSATPPGGWMLPTAARQLLARHRRLVIA